MTLNQINKIEDRISDKLYDVEHLLNQIKNEVGQIDNEIIKNQLNRIIDIVKY